MKQNQTLTVMDAGRMTSLEIAEITGKPHNDVLKAIRKMEQAWVKVNGGNFSTCTVEGSYQIAIR